VADSLHASGRLRPDIVRDLGLSGAAFEDSAAPLPYVSLLGDGAKLELYTSAQAPNADSIRKFSARDAARWPEFVAFMDRAIAFLDAAYRTPMPRLPHFKAIEEGLPLAKLLWKLRRLGGKDMFRVVRAMSMSVEEFHR
jgi:phytoene dehydrogenase-like protein